ncbi:protein kinase domain-containing protein [Catellatospora vulcania]|uniref:protein kinase domain-containing protein n=1 Tax=Catellatospora vulcania TaxID=1460450 RepID=UPI0012D44812|nr:protein kinase [Catellatospora vulcania]
MMYEGPEAIDGYHDLVRIGHGGFSVVYRAHQEVFEREVAVKVLMVGSDEALRRRFLREVKLTAQLSSHPHVVTILDAGMTASGRPYLATELYEHGSLHERVREQGRLAPDEVVRIGVKIAGALAAAHEAGMVHRDVKPSNILISRYGEPVLADFGVAWLLDGHSSATMLDVFSPHHVAPETVNGGRPGPASDVYALGSTMYHLLRGSAPYSGEGDDAIAAVLWRTVHDPVPHLDLPESPGLADVLTTAMAKDPAQRYPHGAAFAEALAALLPAATAAPAPVPPLPPRPPAAVPRPAPAPADETMFRPDRALPAKPSPAAARRFGVDLAAGAGVGALLVAVTAFALWPAPAPPPAAPPEVPTGAALEQARPHDVTVLDEQEASALVRWTVTGGRDDRVLVRVLSAEPGMRPRDEIAPRGVTELRIGGLTRGTGYCFLVGAVLGPDEPAPMAWSRPRCIRDAELRGPFAQAVPTPEES